MSYHSIHYRRNCRNKSASRKCPVQQQNSNKCGKGRRISLKKYTPPRIEEVHTTCRKTKQQIEKRGLIVENAEIGECIPPLSPNEKEKSFFFPCCRDKGQVARSILQKMKKRS